jgi:hypothetical protein
MRSHLVWYNYLVIQMFRNTIDCFPIRIFHRNTSYSGRPLDADPDAVSATVVRVAIIPGIVNAVVGLVRAFETREPTADATVRIRVSTFNWPRP